MDPFILTTSLLKTVIIWNAQTAQTKRRTNDDDWAHTVTVLMDAQYRAQKTEVRLVRVDYQDFAQISWGSRPLEQIRVNRMRFLAYWELR